MLWRHGLAAVQYRLSDIFRAEQQNKLRSLRILIFEEKSLPGSHWSSLANTRFRPSPDEKRHAIETASTSSHPLLRCKYTSSSVDTTVCSSPSEPSESSVRQDAVPEHLIVNAYYIISSSAHCSCFPAIKARLANP